MNAHWYGLPATSWWPGLRDFDGLRADLIAGLSIALVLIPQAVAYAQLAGLPPLHGLYAAFLPVIAAALFGWSKHLQTGPTALVCLMTAAALGPLVAPGEAWILYALTLAVLVGAFQLLFGFLRLGMLVNFLAAPVIAGFTSAAAIIIATSQLGALFGIEQPRGGWHFLGVHAVLADLEHAHLPTLLAAGFTLAVIGLLKWLRPRWPAYMIALVLATVLSWQLGFEARGGAVVGELATGLPSFTLPAFSPAVLADLLLVAVTIALIGFVETSTVIRALSARSRQPLNLDREMIGQGLANIAAGISASHPVSGSLSRSHLAIDGGARSSLAAMVAGLCVGIVLLAAAPLLQHLPRASLAIVIISAITGLIQLAPFRGAFNARRSDGVIGVITFGLTLAVAPALHQSVLVGVLMSLGVFVFRAMTPSVPVLGRHPDGSLRNAQAFDLPACDLITVLRFDGPLFFANALHFEEKALSALAEKESLRYLVVDCSAVNEIDATGELMLRRVHQRLDQAGVTLLLATVRSPVRDVLTRTGLMKQIGPERVLRDTDRALEYAWDRLEPGHRDKCPLRIFIPTQA